MINHNENGIGWRLLLRRGIIVGFVFLLVVPGAAHLLYSWMGFNPTDGGFILAGSRRLLEGQVPHRDFISIRTFGSYLLHVPTLLVGGEYVIWISRYISWLQFACIAWAWVIITERLAKLEIGQVRRVLFALIAFVLCAHNWPVMAWHSTDALFLASVGIALCTREKQWVKLAGYFLIGLSVTCRQNFAPMILVLVLGDWKNWKCWLAAFAAPVLFALFLLATGAATDAYEQLTSQSGLWQIGVIHYLKQRWLYLGMLMGVTAAWLLSEHGRKILGEKLSTPGAALGALIILAILARAAIWMARGRVFYVVSPCFTIFGAVIGVLVVRIIEKRSFEGIVRPGFLALGAAWCVSISVGYPGPALAAGVLGVLLLFAGGPFYIPEDATRRMKAASLIVLSALTLACLACFDYTRRNHIYREAPVRELAWRLDGVLSGAKLISTNERTYNVMAGLHEAIRKAQAEKYAIIPDFAAHWVRSKQLNPLPVDWAVKTEFNSEKLRKRMFDRIESCRGEIAIIVQKLQSDALPRAYKRLPDKEFYLFLRYVRSNFTRTAETEFFEIYK
ncbi:MAG: hypothetical protein E3J72_13005 [Planctomycetota bacterium]|nr:MAG: hypothetical protein E3J72_13005 [Planctomycetota bacterium]